MARRAQLDLRQSEKFIARKSLSFLTPKILLRAARVYGATPPLSIERAALKAPYAAGVRATV
jgi:hypothetical protein